MNIALFVPGGVDRSGIERVTPALLWLIERLTQRHTVHVFALHQEEEPGEWMLSGAHVHSMGTKRGRRRRLSSSFTRHHRHHRFDVIHAFGGGPGVYAALMARLHRRPLLLQLTGGELVSLPELAYGSWRTRRGRMAIGFAARNARVVTVASEPMRRLAESREIAAEVVPLGVALDAWPVRAPAPRDPGSRVRLLHIADINPVKDHRTVLHAALWLRDAALDFQIDFAGVDTLDGSVQAAASDLGLSGVTRWHGRLGRGRLRELVEDSDVLVLTSRHEAGPLAVLEAAVAGVPTVGTAVGHIAELAPDAAIAVSCGDSAAIAASILSLVADEPARVAMAIEAQKRAIERDADYTVRRFEQLYQSMLA